MSLSIPIQHRISKVLQNVQILTQNECIEPATKNRVVALLREARKTNDMTELHTIFKEMEHGALFPDIIDELVQITSQT